MIGRLSGRLVEKRSEQLLVDVQGVGYEVLVSLNTFFQVPDIEQALTLHTHLVVREDAQQLYGFATDSERSLFRELIKINGVGPKLALGILSGLTAEELVRCVQSNDSATLVRLPGVGKKTAERLLIELRDRVEQLQCGTVAPPPTAADDTDTRTVEEAESALRALGYKPAEASRLVQVAHSNADPTIDSETLIRLALKSVVKK